MNLWRNDVVEALKRLGGVAHLSQIYEIVREIRPGPLPQNLKAIVRKELEYNSSDTDAFQHKHDLFYSVDGIGNGVWGLREFKSEISYNGEWLVLTENEVNANPKHKWHDVTGVRYHFPNKYINRLKPGTPFIYYRGSKRADGTKKMPEYFGCGTIGEVWEDPETVDKKAQQKHWFFEVEEYEPFATPIGFLDKDEHYLETGTNAVRTNYFWDGVRSIDRKQFENILNQAGVEIQVENPVIPAKASNPTLDEDGLMVPRLPGKRGTPGRPAGSGYVDRRSRSAKEIGDLGEKIVLDYLRKATASPQEADKIIWVAQKGEKPGYDIEDQRNRRAIVGYEVKATTGPAFPYFDLTDNEREAARRMGDRYFLVLVVDVKTENPRLEIIQNPHKLIEQGELMVRPVVHRVEKRLIED